MPGKYAPLEKYLRDLSARKNEVTLSFEQIEAILKFKLPSSAYEDERWWLREKEGNHVNLRAWLSVGWKIARVEVDKNKPGWFGYDGEGQCVVGVTVHGRGGVAPVRWADVDAEYSR